MWIKYVITVGKRENADDKKEKHQTAETAPQVVLQTCITPSSHNTLYKIREPQKTPLLINQSVTGNQWKLVGDRAAVNIELATEKSYLPSVLWHCWLGHLTRKNPSPIWPICVWWDVKPYSINHKDRVTSWDKHSQVSLEATSSKYRASAAEVHCSRYDLDLWPLTLKSFSPMATHMTISWSPVPSFIKIPFTK